ncbi:hypothetical protein [Bradyrhizobium roseum]|uniref:hypothetical protein n=1 Tax=Bradyrhizobium roseum TaxID=3056648 RepID=UPI00262ADDC0|nr:hypothetical protein [Bradyrhizobium roseus]WKA28006.1 hypothetical protein QUH67_31380 [Bradyrhizobium roseus]
MTVLAAVCALIAIALMFLNRIKMLFKAFRDCGLTVGAARDGFRALVADAKTRPGSYLLGIAIICSFALFAEYILLGLVALGTPATLLAAIGGWRGFEIEKRSAGYESCPLFTEESYLRDGAKAAG